MPTCPIQNCHAKYSKKSGEKITFHRLPKNEQRRKEWISILKLNEKRVTNNTLICSKHFSKEMFDCTSLSCVRLRENAIPKIVENIEVTENQQHSENIDISNLPSKQLAVPKIVENIEVTKNKWHLEDIDISNLTSKRLAVPKIVENIEVTENQWHSKNIDISYLPSKQLAGPSNINCEEFTNNKESNLVTCDTETQTEISIIGGNVCDKATSISPHRVMNSPTKRYLRKSLVHQRKQSQSKIKTLQQNVRRNKKRIAHFQTVIQDLQSKRFLDQEQLDILNGTRSIYSELLKRKFEKGDKNSACTKYTPTLRTFALTLNYYSPRTYNYL